MKPRQIYPLKEQDGVLPPLARVIARHGLRPHKSLGQNFLLDLNLTGRIARSVPALRSSTIYEVGPGPGGLTRALLNEGAPYVIALEKDRRCQPALREIVGAFKNRLRVIEGDAMRVDETRLFRDADLPVRIASNLPYNVGTALLVKWLTIEPWPAWFSSLNLMFQREVAERIVAEPGSRSYGRLSVLSQWRCIPRIVFDISPKAFTPVPKVSSSLVLLLVREKPDEEGLEAEWLGRVTRAAFGQRRKMLRSSLKELDPKILPILKELEIDPRQRAENLDVAGYCALAKHLQDKKFR